jgi:hypothetical protein
MLLIWHHSSTVRMADPLLALSAGRIAERGCHAVDRSDSAVTGNSVDTPHKVAPLKARTAG